MHDWDRFRVLHGTYPCPSAVSAGFSAASSASSSGARSSPARKETVRSLRFWDLEAGQEVPRIDGALADFYARLSPDGRSLGSWDNGVNVWDPATGKKRSRVRNALDFAFLPDGQTFAVWMPPPFRSGYGQNYDNGTV